VLILDLITPIPIFLMEKTKTNFFRVLLFVIPALSCINAYGQIASPNTWVVYFTNKGNTLFSLAQPTDYLSQRAISRRVNHQIQIDSLDLPVHQAYVDSVVARGFTLLNKSKWLNAISVFSTDSTLITSLNNLPFIEQIVNVKAKNNSQPFEKWNEEVFSKKSFIQPIADPQNSFTYGPSLRQISMLQGDLLHANGFRGEGMLIAVLDAGFWNLNNNAAFDSLIQNGRLFSTWDFVEKNTDVFDDNNHGTSVLSTMASIIPGLLVGTAPYADYILLRTEDVDSEFLIEEFNWVCGAEYADSAGADILNSSLGYTTFDNPAMNYSYMDLNGINGIASRGAKKASEKGILVINSAGNSGSNSWFYIGVPADSDEILAVGAVDSLEVITNFSSRGPSYDGRIKPDVAAMGKDVVLANGNGGIQTGNGTSFSAPIMAGMAACLWQSNPNLTNMHLRQAIIESCDQFNNPDSEKGYGIPDFGIAFSILNGKKINQPKRNTQMVLSPNPCIAFTDLNLYSRDTQIINVSLFNAYGQLMQEEKLTYMGKSNTTLRLNLSELPAGIYMIDVNGLNIKTTQKIIKQ